jgi:hypothetical protein
MTTRLPGAARAQAADEKFTDYLLDPTRRPDLARLFRALGYTRANWESLRNKPLREIPHAQARPSRQAVGGVNWIVDLEFEGASRTPTTIRTVWFVPTDDGPTRFTTAYRARRRR